MFKATLSINFISQAMQPIAENVSSLEFLLRIILEFIKMPCALARSFLVARDAHLPLGPSAAGPLARH